MLVKGFKIIFFIFFTLSISGCGMRLFSPRETNPVIEDYVGTWPKREIGTLATDAAHRVTVIRMHNGENINEHAWQKGEFCAEPPPDAMVNIAGAFGAAIAANIKIPDPQTGTGGAEGSGQAEFYRTIATIMSPLLRRSQGLQWSRDNLSFVCSAYLNRVISKSDYLTLVNTIITKSDVLIAKEIENLPKLDVTITATAFPGAIAPVHTILLPNINSTTTTTNTTSTTTPTTTPASPP
jgi:hypothetical protein